MNRVKFKRCVASLLLIILVVGLFSPATVFATETKDEKNIGDYIKDDFGLTGGLAQNLGKDTVDFLLNNASTAISKTDTGYVIKDKAGKIVKQISTSKAGTAVGNAVNTILGNAITTDTAKKVATIVSPIGHATRIDKPTGTAATTQGQSASSSTNTPISIPNALQPYPGDNSNIRQAGSRSYFISKDVEDYSKDEIDGLPQSTSGSGYINARYTIDKEVLLANLSKKSDANDKYFNFIDGQAGSLNTDSWMTLLNRLVVFDNGGREFIGMDQFPDDLAGNIKEDLKRFETSGAPSLNETTLGHYLAMSFLIMSNPSKFTENDAESDLTSALKYDGGITIQGQLLQFGMKGNPDSGSDIVNSADHVFNPSNLGVLSINPGLTDDQTDVEKVDVISKLAAAHCVIFYGNMAKEIYSAHASNTVDNPEIQAKLATMKLYNEMFGEIFPYIKRIYTYSNNGVSIENLVNDYNVEVNSETLGALSTGGSKLYEPNTDDETPLNNFYRINGVNSIVSYNRESILNDINVDMGYDDYVAATREQFRRDNTLLQSDVHVEDKTEALKVDVVSGLLTSPMSKYLDDVQEAQRKEANTSMSITEEGISTSAEDIIFNDYILEGMKYSTNYVPMRTNLYASDVLSKYDETFLKEFYYKYGFNRKALYIDTSGSSAVDYYTAGGKMSGSTKLCTLRDIMECGDNDVTLYIDKGFYNADDALSMANAQRATRNNVLHNLADDLGVVLDACQSLTFEGYNWLSKASNWFESLFVSVEVDGEDMSLDEFYTQAQESIYNRYKYDLNISKTEVGEISKEAQHISNGWLMSAESVFDESVIRTRTYDSYSDNVMNILAQIEDTDYVSLIDTDDMTEDNKDTIVMPSSFIKKYMSTTYEYSSTTKTDTEETKVVYSGYSTYSPLTAVAFVSLLYRTPRYYTLAGAVVDNNPVFMASDNLCSEETLGMQGDDSDYGNQWYRNSLLNWALIKNLKANVQVDYTYCIDLDCPVYMDIFGNITTESGIVVIPASSNATLHTAQFKNYNVATGLYSVYGKIYSVPLTLEGAYSVLHPFFIPDYESDTYIIAPLDIGVNGATVSFDKMNFYDENVKQSLQTIYADSVRTATSTTRLNWMAMVNVINEVLRGAPMSNIDKEKEDLYAGVDGTQSAIIAAVKYESLLSSLQGTMQNTLISIPNFATMDSIEYFVALLIKLMIVLTAGVIIILIYRDGVSEQLGWRTLWRSLSAIALTFLCIVVTPAIFQLTYYAANKAVLEKEAFRILMINEEKRKTGIEVGMTSASMKDFENDEFTIQLDWVDAPWWKEMEYVLYGNTVRHVNETKLEAYSQSPVYGNSDVILENDGVFVSTSELFDSVGLDYTWKGTSNGTYGMYLWNTNSEQSANFYTPYYVFLQSLVANVNEYNSGRSIDSISNYNYTTKLMSGKIKTVGLSYNYFNSTAFMEDDVDIMRLFQIYLNEDAYVPPEIDADFDIRYALDLYGNQIEIDPETGEAIDAPIPPDIDAETAEQIAIQPEYTIGQIQRQLAEAEQYAFDRTVIFDDTAREGFRHCLWYNTGAVHDFGNRVKALDKYARDFVANNHDLMDRVSDETFIKVMALYMSVKYNQLFGIDSANSLEIYNLDSEDLLRLCLLKDDEAALSVSMSFPRLVYNYGGEASIYAAAILSVILWVGSFIKPLCTVIVFISVFLSIWVFKVVLRRPSANLYGYLITTGLLCATNLLHSLLLKLSVFLPNTGLSILGCLIFMIVAQVAYLLVLAYVTGVSLRDWSNLGYTEYEKEAMHVKAKLKGNSAEENLSGKIKHHEDNWDYYNDLVAQHRSRNA